MNTVWRSIVAAILGIHDSAKKAWSRMFMTSTSFVKMAFLLLLSFHKYVWVGGEDSYGEEV